MSDYIIQVRPVKNCPHGWPAYRGYKGTDEHLFYYIRQPNEINEMSWYRCSKDWEPSYIVNNTFKIHWND